MTYFKSFMEKYFEEPFLRAELHRAQMENNKSTKCGYQEELSRNLLKNHRAFQNWATK